MKMHGVILQTALVQWIRSVFQQGLVLNDDVIRFAESTFGTQDMMAVLEEAPDCETGPLLELLCYPDRELQIRFENRWGDYPFSEDDRSAITAQLCRAPLKTIIKSTSGTPLGPIVIPAFVLETSIQRLQLTRHPPAQLARAIAGHYSGKQGLVIRVHLRNTRLSWHGEQLRLMELFLTKMPAGTDDFEDCLVFLLSILAELMPGSDIVDFLIAKKMFYFKSLCQAENFERRRRTSNMEVLMLQGERASYGSIPTWRRRMRMIDGICRALFGRTRYFERPMQECLNLEYGTGKLQIQDFIRQLSA
jgi:hypothetical protein